MKIKLEEKVILDKEHMKIIGNLYLKIEKLEKDNTEMSNIEKQHKHMNGELHKEIAILKQEIKGITTQNSIFKQHLQARVLKSSKA